MPYVRIATSVKMDETNIANVRRIVGEAICVIPGKVFEHTMIQIEAGATISRGDPEKPVLFIEARLFGPAPISAKQKFAAVICELLEKELGVGKEFMFMNILELDTWGSNGNFNSFR